MKNLVDVQKHPNFDPNSDYSPAVAVRHDGHRLQRHADRSGAVDRRSADQPEAEGQDHVPELDGRRADDRDARERRRPDQGDRQVVQPAFNRIKKAVDDEQIRQFTGNDYAPPLAKGDLTAAMSWSGDIAQLGNKHLHWNIPEAGGTLWTDNMLIPKGGNVYTASVYMNYVYDPKVQGLMEAGDPKRNIKGIYYIPPVAGAGEAAKKYDPAVAKNPLIFPTKRCWTRCTSSTARR